MKKGIIAVLSAVVGAVAGMIGTGKVLGDKNENIQKMSDKHAGLFLMMNEWVRVKQEGKNLDSYFNRNGYHKIAVYGMSYAGETLINELKGTDIEVAYGIDRNADSIYADIDVVVPENVQNDVDAVVVTAIAFYDEVEEMLSRNVSCPVISLEDILYEM